MTVLFIILVDRILLLRIFFQQKLYPWAASLTLAAAASCPSLLIDILDGLRSFQSWQHFFKRNTLANADHAGKLLDLF